MLIRPFKSLLPKLELISSPDVFFANMKKDYLAYRDSGYFNKENKPAYYIIQIEDQRGQHIGLIAHSAIEDLRQGKILKHEKTISKKEQIMIDFLLQNRASVKPILLTYPHNKSIEQTLLNLIDGRTPSLTIEFDDNLTHQIWKIVEKSELKRLSELYHKHIDKCVIADGHHRYQAIKRLSKKGEQMDSFMTCFLSHRNLDILDYNRVVNIQGLMSPIELIAKLSKYCKIKALKDAGKPTKAGRFHLYTRGEWYQLKWKKKLLNDLNEVEILDASLINDYLLGRILGINDVRSSPRLKYVTGDSDIHEVVDPLEKDRYKIALFLAPLTIEQVDHASKIKLPLPPKSTYFEPRIKSGIVVSQWG